MFTHTHTTEIKTAAGKVITDARTYQGEGEENLSGAVAADDTTEFPVPLDVSKLVAFYVRSDKDVTLNTNDAVTLAADDTFELEAGKALIWNTNRGICPLTVDVTSLFVINADPDVDANIVAGFLLNL